ncbi:MAG: permease-like cell division protein FtsX [Clostridia bacterium]|nr:permease-like cell division protein FtsX [Clostridia bacterium]
MKYNILSYLIGEGFKNVLKNKKSTGASLMIMCATMIIFGVFFMIGENINHIMSELEMQQGMQVFIKDDVSEKGITELGDKIRALSDVNKVEFVSKEDALNQMKEKVGDKQFLLSGYEENNPFPASYIVTLTDLSKSEEVRDIIKEFEGVKDDIQLRGNTINALIKVANLVRIVSGTILVLLVVISVFIIANTIKLTVHARRREISIMKYVGATNNFIRWPFIVEGIIIGVISALISIMLLGISYNLISEKLITTLGANVINIDLLTFSDMFALIIIVYLALGIGIGTLGSIISMRKYLDV